MTRFDDELKYICVWGRWRIDQARNDSGLPLERRLPRGSRGRVVVHGARAALRRGRAQLRLVTAVGTLVESGDRAPGAS